jgi:hypothetical protein
MKQQSSYPIYSPPNYYMDSKFAGEVQQPLLQTPRSMYVHPVQVAPSECNDCKDIVVVEKKDNSSTLKGVFAGISTFTILEVIRTIFF